ncbi:glycosyltransferase family 2 protein [Gilvibacter sp.]|uniref:glycosyltransferase family 2 protein n=1 Tax=Gilvibacter sp. TaxID=2729997 RepID=UPI003F4A1BA4
MDSKRPLVTAIITTYNRTDYLAEAIASVCKQSYDHLEVLVIDDGSVDKVAEQICEQFPGVKYHYKTNGGLSSARNYGVSLAQGEFICFLDDDDLWKPEKVEVQLQAFKAFGEVQLVHSSASVIDAQGELTGAQIGASPDKAHKRSGKVFWNALGVWVPKSPTVMICKSAFADDLLFDETIKVGEDIDFYQRFCYRYPVRYINEPLALYREYEQTDRLSAQRAKYLGIGLKMLRNFSAMGVGGFQRWKIAQRLLTMELRHYAQAYPDRPLKIPAWRRKAFPIGCLKQYFSH